PSTLLDIVCDTPLNCIGISIDNSRRAGVRAMAIGCWNDRRVGDVSPNYPEHAFTTVKKKLLSGFARIPDNKRRRHGERLIAAGAMLDLLDQCAGQVLHHIFEIDLDRRKGRLMPAAEGVVVEADDRDVARDGN